MNNNLEPPISFVKDISKNKSKHLKCLYFNARSICNKLKDFYILLKSERHDIIFVSETWLTGKIANSEIVQNSSYDIFRHDRNLRLGGGVAILFKKCLKLKIVVSPIAFQNVEMLTCDLTLAERSYRIVLVYRPPNTDSEDDILFLRSLYHAASTTKKIFCC